MNAWKRGCGGGGEVKWDGMGSYVAPAIVVFAERTGVPLSLSAELGFGVLARLVLFVFILIAPLTPPYHHRTRPRSKRAITPTLAFRRRGRGRGSICSRCHLPLRTSSLALRYVLSTPPLTRAIMVVASDLPLSVLLSPANAGVGQALWGRWRRISIRCVLRPQ